MTEKKKRKVAEAAEATAGKRLKVANAGKRRAVAKAQEQDDRRAKLKKDNKKLEEALKKSEAEKDEAVQQCDEAVQQCDKFLCFFCNTRERSVVFMPCAHMVACAVCAVRSNFEHHCPMCRGDIEEKVSVIMM